MKRFFIIDGNAYIHRAYHALPPFTTKSNQQINAIYGFVKLLFKITNTFNPDFMAVCFDFPSKNFRHQLFNDYKTNRKPLDTSLINQMPIAREAVDALGIKKIELEGFEADDLIAFLTEQNKKNNVETVIVTGDKDILQLAEDKDVLIWNDSKNIMYDKSKVIEKYGINPNQIADMLSLMGDASDNIPGVKGIGEKTAVKLLQRYNTLENILENVSYINGNIGKLLQQYKDTALLSKKLVELNKNIPLEYNLTDFEAKKLDLEKSIPFFQKYEFKSLIKTYGYKVNVDTQLTSEASTANASKVDFEIISSLQRAAEIVNTLKEVPEISLKIMASLESQIVGISLSIEKEDNIQSFYIPINHKDLTSRQIKLENLKSIFVDIFDSSKVKIIGHNLKQERNICNNNNIKLTNIFFDTMLASYCLNTLDSHNIFDIAEKYLNIKTDIADCFTKDIKKIKLTDIPLATCANYASLVSSLSFKFYKFFCNKLIKENRLNNLFFNIEMPLVEILLEMEINGIKVDYTALRTFSNQVDSDLKAKEQEVYKLSDAVFNINSPKQLANILFEKLNLPIIKKIKTGYSTDEEVLLELSSYKVASEVLKFRELQKLKNTYIDPLLSYLNFQNDRIHTVFNQTVTATGRLSSTDPNLQNIPIRSSYGKELRKVFVPEKETIFISADYSQIDLRVLAHVSKDKKLIEDFNNNLDIHNATAREIFNIAESQPVPENLRSAAKAINFGIIYGISPFGLSKQLSISVMQAKSYIDAYLTRYHDVKLWMKQVIDDAIRDGYVCTISGRLRYMKELISSNARVRAAGERIALNMPIQGSSADIIKIAMINIYNELKINNCKSLMLLQVHDDLLFEVPIYEKNKLISIIKDKMEHAVNLNVPLCVDIKIGSNWGQMQKYKTNL